MDDALLKHYLATDYRVRLPQGGYASMRIDTPLPAPLHGLLQNADEPWAFITAWNPLSQAQSRAANRHAQRRLLAALRAATPAPTHIHAGIGVGQDVWRESSLFIMGMEFDAIEEIMRPFRQNAIVRGCGTGLAQLHLTPDP